MRTLARQFLKSLAREKDIGSDQDDVLFMQSLRRENCSQIGEKWNWQPDLWIVKHLLNLRIRHSMPHLFGGRTHPHTQEYGPVLHLLRQTGSP